MATARSGHTATQLRDGKVLVPNGGDSDPAELYDPEHATWAVTGTIPGGRGSHTATLLPDGRVLVAGGADGRTGLPAASASLYDPTSGRWTATGSLKEARAGHEAILLPDGRVLVVGGAIDPDGDIVLASAELYDPRSGSWSATGAMSGARSGHTASLLSDGRVLVAGGLGRFVNQTDSRALASGELYDPDSGRWTTAASMAEARFGHTSTILPDGQVLVAGGSSGFGLVLASAELYDPSSTSWTASGRTIEARSGHTATLIADGRVLVAGGHSGDVPLASAELYDSSGGSWAATEPTATPRQGHTATLLSDGRVLVAGGIDSSDSLAATAELYDPGTGS